MARIITLIKQIIVSSFTKILLSTFFFVLFLTTVTSQTIFDNDSEIGNTDLSSIETWKKAQVSKKNGVKIFPNPIRNNTVHIQFETSIFIHTIKIYDILGKGVFIKKITSSENKISLKPNLSSGIYILTINTRDNGSISKKMIVQ